MKKNNKIQKIVYEICGEEGWDYVPDGALISEDENDYKYKCAYIAAYNIKICKGRPCLVVTFVVEQWRIHFDRYYELTKCNNEDLQKLLKDTRCIRYKDGKADLSCLAEYIFDVEFSKDKYRHFHVKRISVQDDSYAANIGAFYSPKELIDSLREKAEV